MVLKYEVVGECWVYSGYKDKDGYGIYGKTGERKAHRITYREFYDDFDPQLQVQHTCNNRSCINPKHLIQGTPANNSKYMSECGRARPGNKIIYEEDIEDMKGFRQLGWEQQKIADFMGISNQSVSNYLRGEG